jgi:hypothetical protein
VVRLARLCVVTILCFNENMRTSCSAVLQRMKMSVRGDARELASSSCKARARRHRMSPDRLEPVTMQDVQPTTDQCPRRSEILKLRTKWRYPPKRYNWLTDCYLWSTLQQLNDQTAAWAAIRASAGAPARRFAKVALGGKRSSSRGPHARGKDVEGEGRDLQRRLHEREKKDNNENVERKAGGEAAAGRGRAEGKAGGRSPPCAVTSSC